MHRTRHPIQRLAAGLGMAALLALAPPLSASTFVALDLDDLVAGADQVVEGQVVDTRSFWNADRTVIRTEATFRVDSVLLGDPPDTVTLETPGGTVGDVRVRVPGFPVFEPGERLLLFLGDAGDGRSRVHGYRQGQFRIVTDATGGRLAVSTVEDGTPLISAEGKDLRSLATQPLTDLERAIHDTARRLSAGGGR